MKALAWSYLFSLALASTVIAAQFPADAWKDASKQTVPGNAVPNRFIVEVFNPNDIPSKRGLQSRDVSIEHLACGWMLILDRRLTSHCTTRYASVL